jgi:hypothetical protein
MDCPKQKCLVHLLRELSDSAQKSPAFASGAFFTKSRRLVKEMLQLKGQWETLGEAQYLPRMRGWKHGWSD